MVQNVKTIKIDSHENENKNIRAIALAIVSGGMTWQSKIGKYNVIDS